MQSHIEKLLRPIAPNVDFDRNPIQDIVSSGTSGVDATNRLMEYINASVDRAVDKLTYIAENGEETNEILTNMSDPGGRYAAGRYNVFNFEQIDNARDPSQWGDLR